MSGQVGPAGTLEILRCDPLQVGAGTESLVTPRKDHTTDAVVGIKLHQGIGDLDHHITIQRIHRLGTIEGDDFDIPLAFDF
jgi:hypothetical protein